MAKIDNTQDNIVALDSFLELKVEDFARLFGTTEDDIPKECLEIIDKTDYRYKILIDREYDAVLLDVLKKIDSGKLTIAGKEKKDIWDSGWDENLRNFIKKGYNLSELIPKYYRPGQPIRIFGKYAKGNDPNIEYNFFKVLRMWLYKKYLKEPKTVYEFGCGPGHNLVALAKLFPEKKIYGLDWAKSSVDLVNKIAKVYELNIKGYLFDMFCPDERLNFNGRSAVITMGALEQLGDNYEKFLKYILQKRPMICFNVEPLCELYDENNLLDYIAIKHHKKRNFLGNYLGSLKVLEKSGQIEILKIQRMFFGGLLVDGWSYVVWRPL